ncbi:MAG: CapA family protein [Treponema sp.]|jgi:poly-gamma-glutamate synthesis protein (capsule biosynthesis protein)|nr:CapA family protein [Treponema sp.]
MKKVYVLLLSMTMLMTACTKNANTADTFWYLTVDYPNCYEAEEAFVRSFLNDTEQLKPLGIQLFDTAVSDTASQTADIHLSFFSDWEHEQIAEHIVLSHTWFVPREDPLTGRTSTSSIRCLAGQEDLVPITELQPPFVALRVDELSVADEDYPLVKKTGVTIQNVQGEVPQALISELAAALNTAALEHNALKTTETERPALFWVAAGGDVLLDRGADKLLMAEGPQSIFGGTAEFLATADLTLINLECAVTDRGTPVPKTYTFRASPLSMPALRASGIDAVLLANNHAFDYGDEGLLDSLKHIKEAGIGVLGVGLNEAEAAAPFLFENTARVFGIASFPSEKNGWDGLSVAAAEDKAGLLHAGKDGAAKLAAQFSTDDSVLDIVLFHGGEEWTDEPDEATRAIYTSLIDRGADLLIGSHPHVVQGFEWIQEKPVFWSLGDYVFGDMWDTHELGGEDGLFIMLGFWGNRLLYLEPYPVSLSDIRTSIAPRENLARFYALSRSLRARTAVKEMVRPD